MARRERRALELAKRKDEKKRRREEADMPVLELLERRRQEYASDWKMTARALEARGLYAWMADLLGGGAGGTAQGKRVLEVGTGTGEGLRMLLDRGWSVVSVDENVACLRAAHEGCESTLLLRGSAGSGVGVGAGAGASVRAGAGAYEVAYAGGVTMGQARAVLVEGDVIGDEGLTAALLAAGPFDAVTCWLLDTHEARMRDAKVRAIGIRTADEYRIGVQRLVYRLANKVLGEGGVLHVVDRAPQATSPGGPALSEPTAQGLLRLRAAMAEGTSLELLALDARESLVSVRSRRGPPRV